MRAGMTLDWYDSTRTIKRGSIKIALLGIDHINRTVNIDSTFGTGAVPTGAAVNDVLVVYGALDPGEPNIHASQQTPTPVLGKTQHATARRHQDS